MMVSEKREYEFYQRNNRRKEMTDTKSISAARRPIAQAEEISRVEFSHVLCADEERIEAFMNESSSLVLMQNQQGERFIRTVEVLSELPELIRKRYYRVTGITWIAEKEVAGIIGLELSEKTAVKNYRS